MELRALLALSSLNVVYLATILLAPSEPNCWKVVKVTVMALMVLINLGALLHTGSLLLMGWLLRRWRPQRDSNP